MDQQNIDQIAERFLAAWNTQDVDQVLDCYTQDVRYLDPNTRGAVDGADALRRYLTKLFANWQMTWKLREAFPLLGENGAAVLWTASLRRADGNETVEVDGMDLVLQEGERIARNEVYFDRAVLAPLLGSA
jgi:ketosteroid isomerase-like protein